MGARYTRYIARALHLAPASRMNSVRSFKHRAISKHGAYRVYSVRASNGMKKIVLAFCALVLLSMPLLASAQETISVSAAQIAPRSEVFFEPASGTFAQGTVFEVPIYL